MTKTATMYAVGVAAGTVSITVWAWLILVPAWASYHRLVDRMLSAVLSLYVLAAMVLAGGLAGALFLWFYDRL